VMLMRLTRGAADASASRCDGIQPTLPGRCAGAAAA